MEYGQEILIKTDRKELQKMFNNKDYVTFETFYDAFMDLIDDLEREKAKNEELEEDLHGLRQKINFESELGGWG